MNPFWTYGDLAALTLLFVPCALLSRLLPVSEIARQVAGYGVWLFLVPAWLYARHRQWMNWGVSKAALLVGLFAGLVLMAIATAIAQLTQYPDIDTPLRRLIDARRELPMIAFAVVVAGPVTEELYFRGLAQPLLTRSFGPFTGNLGVAIPFGILHADQLQMSVPNVALIVMAGAGFGAIRYRLDSLFAAIVMHSVYNGLLLGGYLLGKNLLHG
ncbi:MAG: type II CAAX endopeptidase family protein [Bryobacteraceae bacterium]|nr:type II CAAX endopeptidase family protein [Bryobacteraceae bacterium]